MLRLIGDVHQNYGRYFDVVMGIKYSLQVGDLGFNYENIRKMKRVINPENHKAIAGNHDCYAVDSENYFRKQKFFLGDFGTHNLGGVEFFYVRGEWSIDWQQRTPGFSWFYEEELAASQIEDCIHQYASIKPSMVVSHGCPFSIVPYVTNPKFARSFGYSDPIKTRTNQLLETLFQEHKPDSWFFGHYHTAWAGKIDGTEFRCLNIGEIYDLGDRVA